MASLPPSQVGADAVVALKLYFEGSTRRAKMSLRDMVPRVLEEQIRTVLHVPAATELLIERYSDSASSYVVIEPGNLAVYKQLYRAAKAKSKLKLRVTAKNSLDKPAPKPASVEDEPDVDAKSSPPKKDPVSNPAEVAAPLRSQTENNADDRVKAILARQDEEFRQRCNTSRMFAQPIPTRTRGSQTIPPAASGNSNISTAETSKATTALREGVLPFGATFAVCCNNCDKTVSGAHYHCSTCDDGDFDLCTVCVERGVTCRSNEHWLIKRIFVNGVLISSNTEVIKPKSRQTRATKPFSETISPLMPSLSDVKPATQVAPPRPTPLPCVLTPPMPKPSPAPKPTPSPVAAPTMNPVLPATTTNIVASARAQGPKHVSKAESSSVKLQPSITQTRQDLPQFAHMRTCNSCVDELPSREFLHCTNCDDYDLCQTCFAEGRHGHHPNHSFAAAVSGTALPDRIKVKLAPGRNQMHHAICDGCDKFINGVRHKCLDCPDWDYCANCVLNSGFIHPGHRFVPVFEPLKEAQVSASSHTVHPGICCDGPLCSNEKVHTAYIRGTRYKCAVCHDLDFCANCEAHPCNEHNKTHPLIMFKTPVRHCSVTTTGAHENGSKMPAMGDRNESNTDNNGTPAAVGNAINAVQTVVDVKPAEDAGNASPAAPAATNMGLVIPFHEKDNENNNQEEDQAPQPEPVVEEDGEPEAVFVRDTVPDGTIYEPNVVFEQTWTLRNNGTVPWPAGCSVKFVGGDYMGHVDSTHPARIPELVSASESTVCYSALAPGQEFSFTVLLRTPARLGKVISYWRLTTQDGLKFGHRLWCEVNVRDLQAPVSVKDLSTSIESRVEAKDDHEEDDGKPQSTMIFPKLEKESPISSMHEASVAAPSHGEEKTDDLADFDDCGAEDDFEASDAGFLTDEEYDILDASDEEFLEELHKQAKKD